MMMVPMHLQTFSPKSVRPVRGICMFDVPTKQFQHPARAGPTTSNLTLMCHRIANAWLNFHSFLPTSIGSKLNGDASQAVVK